MSQTNRLTGLAQGSAVIVLSYVLAHGLTATIVTPVQAGYLPDITVFASLIYLPHGVRVLATWLWGWKAILPLYVGSYSSFLLFTPDADRLLIEPTILESMGIGATSAFVAFVILRGLGVDAFARADRRLTWRSLLLVGAIASVLNSIGQTLVFAGTILPDDAGTVLAVYATGDLIGLSVCMIVLMFVFRSLRLRSAQRVRRG